MNNEEMSEMIQKLTSMMNQSNSTNSTQANTEDISSYSNDTSSDNFQNGFTNMNDQSEENDHSYQDNDNHFNFDFETMMKMKTIMDKVNSSKNSPEANLLLSLKPYLNQHRRQKLDQYMQFLNIAKVMEAFNSNGGVNHK